MCSRQECEEDGEKCRAVHIAGWKEFYQVQPNTDKGIVEPTTSGRTKSVTNVGQANVEKC